MRKFSRLLIAPLVSLVALVTMPLFVAPAAAAESCTKIGVNIVCTGDINLTVKDVVNIGDVDAKLLNDISVTIGNVLSNNDVCKADKHSKACSDLIIAAVKALLVLKNIKFNVICVGSYCKA